MYKSRVLNSSVGRAQRALSNERRSRCYARRGDAVRKFENSKRARPSSPARARVALHGKVSFAGAANLSVIMRIARQFVKITDRPAESTNYFAARTK